MFGRTSSSVTAKMMMLTLVLATTQASPIGLYAKFSGLFFWGSGSSKKENIAPAIHGVWQPNRDNIIELAWGLPFTTIKGSDGEDVKHAWTFTKKGVIPLKYYLNVYTQWGASWKSALGLHAPFFGVGMSYYHNRWCHIDISWRNHSLPRGMKRDGSPRTRGNCLVIGGGIYIR